jgi:hypothetical protein
MISVRTRLWETTILAGKFRLTNCCHGSVSIPAWLYSSARRALELGAGVDMRNKERRIVGENRGGGSKWQGKRKQETADEYIHVLSFYKRLIWLYIAPYSRPGQ